MRPGNAVVHGTVETRLTDIIQTDPYLEPGRWIVRLTTYWPTYGDGWNAEDNSETELPLPWWLVREAHRLLGRCVFLRWVGNVMIVDVEGEPKPLARYEQVDLGRFGGRWEVLR